MERIHGVSSLAALPDADDEPGVDDDADYADVVYSAGVMMMIIDRTHHKIIVDTIDRMSTTEIAELATSAVHHAQGYHNVSSNVCNFKI